MKRIIISVFILFSAIFFANAQQAQSADNLSIIQKVERWYGENMNYGTIAVLMTVESSFIPFPSEVVIPPAAYVAANNDPEINKNRLNIFLVIVFGTIGALIGAYINYFLALWLGRPILYKFADSKLGKVLMLSSEKIKKAEDYFNKHGNVSTLIGRFIPVIRQFISIPAGLAKMNLLSFSLYTFIGAGAWNCILALLGYIAHGQADTINKYSHELSIIIGVLFCLGVGFLIVRHFWKKSMSHN
jgi:membrane protein DedA with SNARE-associated domain